MRTEASDTWEIVAGLWDQIDEEEGVHDKGQTIEWMMVAGAEKICRLRDGRASLTDQLVNRYGADSELAVELPVNGEPTLFLGGEEHDGTLARTEWNGGDRPGRKRVLFCPTSDRLPALVIGQVEERDLPARLCFRLGVLAGAALLEGPARGFPDYQHARENPTNT
jgi:hypothetical protein